MPVMTDGYKLLRQMFRDSDTYDAWGNAMEWFFAVADVLWHQSAEDIPATWQYGHAPGCGGMESDDSFAASLIMDEYDDGSVTDDDLLAFGSVLDRYTNVLRLAGRDY